MQLKRRYSITAIIPPCHGEDAGSIPVTCSNRLLSPKGLFFLQKLTGDL